MKAQGKLLQTKKNENPKKIKISKIFFKCDFIVLSQVNEISLTVNQFH